MPELYLYPMARIVFLFLASADLAAAMDQSILIKQLPQMYCWLGLDSRYFYLGVAFHVFLALLGLAAFPPPPRSSLLKKNEIPVFIYDLGPSMFFQHLPCLAVPIVPSQACIFFAAPHVNLANACIVF